MGNWFFSLQFRLIAVFAAVLALALFSVGMYGGFTLKQGTERFQHEVEEARATRVQQVITQYYGSFQGWEGMQRVIERASSLYGLRIVLTDLQGRILADSHWGSDTTGMMTRRGSRLSTVLYAGREVASVAVAPSLAPPEVSEPKVAVIVSALQSSLLWAGLAAVAGGVLLVSLLSKRVLTPVRDLSLAARRLGQGDLSQRVSAEGRDEVAYLGSTFNSMAEDLEKA